MSRRMSRTIVCPKCDSFAVVVERTEDFHYIVKCRNCGEVKLTALEERKARTKYSKRMKIISKPCRFQMVLS